MQLPLGPDLEPEMEALLTRLVPDYTSLVVGASIDEIAAMERMAARPLPNFYRWFLWRMGRSMGPFAYRGVDFAVDKVLLCYANGTFKPDSQALMIGYGTDSLHPMHIGYDLEHPTRADARVVTCSSDGAIDAQDFETFREKLGYSALNRVKVMRAAQRFEAVLSDEQTGSVASLLRPVLEALNFTVPLETGTCCLLYERADAALIGLAELESGTGAVQAITLAAQTEAQVRSIVGTIVSETGMTLDEVEWDPPP
jgi:hypothetical protein